MNSKWITIGDVIAITGWHERTIRLKDKFGEIQSKLSDKTGRNGRRKRLYDSSSLPSEYQQRVLEFFVARAAHESQQALISQPPTAVLPRTDQQTLPLFASPCANGERLLVPEYQRETVERRLRAIQPLIDWKRGVRPIILTSDNQPLRNMDQMAAWIATQHGVNRATVWEWYSKFSEQGLPGLCDRVRRDKGTSRFFDHHPNAAKWVQAKFVGERLSYMNTHQSLLRAWGTPQLCESGEPPSYETLRTYLASVPKAIVVVGREGERGYNSKIEAFLQRDPDSVRVNQIWVSDHRVFDAFVYNDVFPHVRPGIDMRLWHTMIIDMRSRKLLGWAFSATPSSNTISSSLHMAMSQYGRPEVFYCDNGKDYKKVGKVELTPEASGVLHRLDVRLQYCLPKHPQSKLIESFNSGESKRFDVLFGNAYAGSKPALRPEQCEQLRRQHKLYLMGKAQRTELMPASDFIALAEQWFTEYNDTVHTGRGMNGLTPNQLFERECPPQARNIPNMQEIAPLFWDRQQRKVLRGGCVELYGQRYEPFDPDSKAALYQSIGRDVLVACDPNDIGNAIILDLDGKSLGFVSAQRLIAHGPISQEDVKASLRERRSIWRALKNYVASIQRGVPSELQLMRSRAGLPALIEAPQPATLPVPANLRLAAGAESVAPSYAEDIAEEFLNACQGEN